MSNSFASRRALGAWLFALALACAPVPRALAADGAPVPMPAATPADRAPESAGDALTPGPPSTRFT